MPIHAGKLAGLASLRDGVAPTYQAQLDELARGLVETFAESDQSGGGGPDAAGIFTYAGGPAVPPSGALVTGLAGSIRVNDAIDPSAGGSLYLLRDGGINGADYVYNGSTAASFSDRLSALVGKINEQRSFDGAAAIGASDSVAGYGTASAAWLEGARKAASAGVDYQNALLSRASDALSNATGVNLDDEYATQLMLEQSFSASSKLISVIGQLFDSLFEAIR
jgi:flagellar hook-associated protein 1 FlgK